LVVALTTKQRGVLKGIIIGATVSGMVLVGSVVWGPRLLSPDASLSERIAFALSADIFIALWLGISVAMLARHRFFTPEDIDGGGLSRGTEAAQVLQATLQNTLEQTVLAVLAHCMWAIVLPVSWNAAIPAAVILFVSGRVLFLRGYRGGAPARAAGFALTFYPTMFMLICIAVATVRNWFD
jgi:hypothetical protein